MKHTIAWGTDELKNQYNHLSSGHWFDPDTMRFFKSRLTSNYRRFDDTCAAFITTECGPMQGAKRLASIRIARLTEYTRESDGRLCHRIEISTLGTFNIMTLAYAKSTLKKLKLSKIKNQKE